MTQHPKQWKMAILVWIAIYPTITVLFALFGGYFAQINPLPLRTLVITIIVVPVMVFAITPWLHKRFRHWLQQ